jgi:hypothetical protein
MLRRAARLWTSIQSARPSWNAAFGAPVRAAPRVRWHETQNACAWWHEAQSVSRFKASSACRAA